MKRFVNPTQQSGLPFQRAEVPKATKAMVEVKIQYPFQEDRAQLSVNALNILIGFLNKRF